MSILMLKDLLQNLFVYEDAIFTKYIYYEWNIARPKEIKL